jgi:hypothetical protein
MQKFEYRTPRYQVDLPVLLQLKDTSVRGRCIEIGKEGMKVELESPVPLKTSGTVTLSYLEVSLELSVTVAHAGTEFSGLQFNFASEKDRAALENLVALLSRASGQAKPVLVK